jgi:hypothetical protein
MCIAVVDLPDPPFSLPTTTTCAIARLPAFAPACPGGAALYNVPEKPCAGERIAGRDRDIGDRGLVGIRRDRHDRIDAAVAEAHGWPAALSDDDIRHRLAALNRERAGEKARGLGHWLRPDDQNPEGRAAVATADRGARDLGPTDTATRAPWPRSQPDQIAAMRALRHDLGQATPDEIARRFQRGRAGTIRPLLKSLTALGHARLDDAGRFVA